jgi:hypothetical protein
MLKDKKKICYKCKGTDDLFEIRAHKGKNIYFLCKPCNKKDKKYYHDSGKKMVYEHYGARCNCCGESKYQFLSVDHVNNDGGEERWPNGNRITGVHLYRRIISSNFPDKYQILCMNCNFGKRMNGGICPHATE